MLAVGGVFSSAGLVTAAAGWLLAQDGNYARIAMLFAAASAQVVALPLLGVGMRVRMEHRTVRSRAGAGPRRPLSPRGLWIGGGVLTGSGLSAMVLAFLSPGLVAAGVLSSSAGVLMLAAAGAVRHGLAEQRLGDLGKPRTRWQLLGPGVVLLGAGVVSIPAAIVLDDQRWRLRSEQLDLASAGPTGFAEGHWDEGRALERRRSVLWNVQIPVVLGGATMGVIGRALVALAFRGRAVKTRTVVAPLPGGVLLVSCRCRFHGRCEQSRRTDKHIAELDALRIELEVEKRTLERERQAAAVGVEVARARHREALVTAQLARPTPTASPTFPTARSRPSTSRGLGATE